MLRTFLLSLLLFLSIMAVKAQTFSKVPKYMSFELGYRYLPATSFDIKNQGITLLFDYAWQLSGFTGKPAAYISIPIGYTYLFAGNGSESGRILSYGWRVKHDLKADTKVTPFLGYGLLLNQLSVNNTEGQVFGHQTCFDYGYRFKTSKKSDYFVMLEYSYSRYPHLGAKKSDSIHAIELKAGIRF